MKRAWCAGLLGALVLATVVAPPTAAQKTDDGGVKVGKPSILRKLVPAAQIEKVAGEQYLALTRQARTKGALLPDSHPQVQRVRRIHQELMPFTEKFHPRSKDWKWEVNVFNSRTINAFCMPGGKIAFFTGILDQLKLTDAEVAAVMGHEIAHALREHARERAAKNMLTKAGAVVVSVLVGGNAGELSRVGGGLLGLKFSRDDEKEADLIGLELAARAGYDPRAGITLWEKMSAAAKGAPPQWLSTHPSGQARIDLIKKHLPEVMPLYERSPKRG